MGMKKEGLLSSVRFGAAATAVFLASVPCMSAAADTTIAAQVHAAVVEQAADELRSIYAHSEQPLWIDENGRLDPAAWALVRLVRTAEYDGLDPRELGFEELERAVEMAGTEHSPAALAKAELLLSRALGNYMAALRSPPATEMIYEHEILKPLQPAMHTALAQARAARSLQAFIENMEWMHPLYAPLRHALAEGKHNGSQAFVATRNLERLRAIPATLWDRHVLIDAAGARLWMYEGDRVVGSMRVVVGKPDSQTPMMAGYIRNAVLNPYWNVPTDLIRQRIAPGVLNEGPRYLRVRNYEVLSGWGDDAQVLEPGKIDWRKVRDGTMDVRVRQRPGASNAMGEVKFEFPNPLGIYLHDTPEKALMTEEARQFSSGCVRLEDAERLGRWLLGGDVPQAGAPEQKIDLAKPVPIYITYLTASADGDQVALGPDPYARDRPEGAAMALRAH